MQVATIELAIVAASWIVGAAIERDMFAIDDLVQSMVEQLYKEQPIRIFLNVDDAALLNGLKTSADAPGFADADVEFVAEAGVARGIVRAESARSVLVTDMDDRLADIRRIWMENLNETQTERRADDPAGRGFRRFPERRHSA
jgi:flagellar biosynthesis/type III secretory pathway protein FliH